MILQILLLLCFASAASAQWNDETYFPEVGQPGVLDTVYGWRDMQQLGAGMINIGPRPGESYGRVWFTGLIGTGASTNDKSPLSQLEGAPSFQLKNFRSKAEPVALKRKTNYRFIPLSHSKSRDLFVDDDRGTPRIYWQDEHGDYDSNRFTSLRLHEVKGGPTVYSIIADAYCTYLSTDSTYDVLIMARKGSLDSTYQDSLFAFRYTRGQFAESETVAYPADSVYLDTASSNGFFAYVAQGDWRGTGREDLIMANFSTKNFFHFSNDKPFSLQKFALSFTRDTLFASWQNPSLSTLDLSAVDRALSMKAAKRDAGDLTEDLVLLHSIVDTGLILHLYRGHSEFGANRLTRDSAMLIIRDGSNELALTRTVRDVGDMTGTGNRVLYVQMTAGPGGYGVYHMFYVMGTAMDNTADLVYYMEPKGRAEVDTITADADGLQDVILGFYEYRTLEDFDRGKDWVGSIQVLHGSRMIAVKGHSSVSSEASRGAFLSVYPNPSPGIVNVSASGLALGPIKVRVIDILGNEVYSTELQNLGHSLLFNTDLGFLPSGTYLTVIDDRQGTHRQAFSIQR